jgi:hypothetical protein
MYPAIRILNTDLMRKSTPFSLFAIIFILIPAAPFWRMGHPRNAVSLQFVNLTVSRTPQIGDQPATRLLPTQYNTNTE